MQRLKEAEAATLRLLVFIANADGVVAQQHGHACGADHRLATMAALHDMVVNAGDTVFAVAATLADITEDRHYHPPASGPTGRPEAFLKKVTISGDPG